LPALIATIDSIGVSPGLVVIDTAAKAIGTADENNQGLAALLCNGQALASHYGCFVLLVHHTGWGDDAQKRTRGWSGLPFGLDLIMLCERKQGELTVTVTIQKLKDDESGERFVAKLERVELGKTKTGRLVSTLVVDSVTQIENAPAVAKPQSSRSQPRRNETCS
jgi:RecA-family ATPase